MSSPADQNGIEALANASGNASCGNHRLIRLPEVIRKVGLKRTAIYERMKRGCFPKSRSLGPRCTVWLETEVDEWISMVAGETED
jgi:prophage regulatory protein